MFESVGFPGAFSGLVLCALVTAVLLVGVYWAVRLAVRDALHDREKTGRD